jgi:phosphonate transport system ATP-binding protein
MKPQIDPTVRDFAMGAAGAAPIVAVSGLAVAFGPKVVLHGIDLTIDPGTAVALIGANGAGKSTLLRSLVRLAEPSAGTMRVLDQDVRGLNARDLRAFRSRIGVVFQRHNLVPRLSALTNVVHGVQARLRGPRTWLQSLAPAEVRAEALACLDAVGLADLARQRADSLSGGQSQRVAIARMLMQRPELVLADEPDASLDPKAGEEVMGLLYRLAKDKGLSLVVISHRIEHTTAFSDRIVGLVGGRMALDARSADAKAAELRAFFTDPVNH